MDGALIKHRGVAGGFGSCVAVLARGFRRLGHRLTDNAFNDERLAVKLIADAKLAIYFFGEEVVSIQIIIVGADHDNVVCGVRHKL